MSAVEPRFRYRYGARVRVRSVDMDGMCGRDLHPDPWDTGSVGYVVAPTVRMVVEPKFACELYLVVLLPDPNMKLGDTRVRPDIGELAFVLRRAKVLEFADYELEPA